MSTRPRLAKIAVAVSVEAVAAVALVTKFYLLDDSGDSFFKTKPPGVNI